MKPWSSPWDGGDRRVLRAGIATLAVFDTVYLVRGLVFEPAAVGPNPNAPAWLLTVAGSRPLLALAALVVVWMLLRFARGRQSLLTGLAGLTALAIVAEAYAATRAGPYRANFFSGAMLLGWLAGEAFGRMGRAGRLTAMRWAEAGAVGALAATYVGAGAGKLLGAGLSWADGATLRGVIRSHAPAGDGLVATLADFVASNPAVAQALSLGTLLVQLSAFAYPWSRRSRVVVGLALVAFHVGVALTTRIGYWQPVVALVLFSLPWPRVLRVLRRESDDDPPDEAALARAAKILGGVALGVVVLAWVNPWRAYTHSHHQTQSRIAPGDGDGAPRHDAEFFGPLRVGDPLAGGWTLAAIDIEPDRARLTLRREHSSAIAWLSPRTDDQSRSPFDTDACRIAYGETAVDLDTLKPALAALAERLHAAAREPADIRAWLDDG